MAIVTHAIAVESNAPLREDTDAGCQQSMLIRKQSGGQRCGRVAGNDGYLDLRDHRTTIELGRDEVHARAMCRVAPGERAFVRLETAIFRQQ